MIEYRNAVVFRFVFSVFSYSHTTFLNSSGLKKPFSEKLRFLFRVNVDGRSNHVEIKPRLQFQFKISLQGNFKTYTYITTSLNEAPYFSHLSSGIMHGQIVIVVENHCNAHGKIFAARQDNKHEMIKLSLFTLLV